MTPRLAQNDDGKLFFRAPDLDAVGGLLDSMFANRLAEPRPDAPPGPGNHTFFFGIQVDLILVYKAVLKTGVNLVAHMYGDDLVRGAAFDRMRCVLLEEHATNDAASLCQMDPGLTPDFPGVNADTHQLMLDEWNGQLRFRMTLQ